ncbi:MAG: hydrogenase nickel incorporation protein HypB [Bacteroidota bacterium]
MSLITVERKVLESNNAIAEENRLVLHGKKIFSINMVSSPGSGKTSIIEKTVLNLKDKVNIGFIVGDLQTSLDAERIDKLGIPSVQIVTNGACHLDASLVRNAYKELSNLDIDFLIIENVGNLVCTAEYDLGEHLKVVVSSVTEGDDKPLKYPIIFRKSMALILNKIDLLPYLTGSIDVLRTNALSVNPKLQVFETSCISGVGIDEWCNWLLRQIAFSKDNIP